MQRVFGAHVWSPLPTTVFIGLLLLGSGCRREPGTGEGSQKAQAVEKSLPLKADGDLLAGPYLLSFAAGEMAVRWEVAGEECAGEVVLEVPRKNREGPSLSGTDRFEGPA